jgi:hypothetical protein
MIESVTVQTTISTSYVHYDIKTIEESDLALRIYFKNGDYLHVTLANIICYRVSV